MKWKLLLMAVVSIFAVSSMYALDAKRPREFKIGVGGWGKSTISDYESDGSRVLKKSQSGYSINLGYEYLKSNAIYRSLDLDFRGYQGTVSGKVNRSDLFYNAQLRLGYSFGSSDDFAFTPFVGIGAESSRLEKTIGSEYDFVRKWNYWTVGVRVDGTINANWDLGFRAQVMPMFSKPRVYDNQVGGLDKARMDKKINYSADMPITYKFIGSGSALRFTPFMESQNMEAPTALGIPVDARKSNLWGARLEYVYKF